MAKINIISICPPGNEKACRITENRHQRIMELTRYAKDHECVNDAHAADIILFYISYSLHLGFLDPWRFHLRKHPIYRKYRVKSLVFDLDDDPIPLLRGLYTGVDKRWYNSLCHHTAPYIHHDYLWNEKYEPNNDVENSEYLFSFVGASNTHSFRNRILGISHTRGLVMDTAQMNPWKDRSVKQKWEDQYIDSIHSSKFVLCPRGRASSTVRLYEVMKAGRVPVIVSDAWVPPTGPDWDSFSIRIPENRVDAIPEILERKENDSSLMGSLAREVWTNWFSKEVLFDRIVDWSLEIKEQCKADRRCLPLCAFPVVLSRRQFRRCILSPSKQGLKTIIRRFH